GASLDVITSYQWSWGALHWNEWFEYTRDHHAYLFSGVILEGPHEWLVRPVSELYVEKEFNGNLSESALLGAIWEVRDWFQVDLGVRRARTGSDDVTEVRFGFTCSIPVWETNTSAAKVAWR
ncbi:MAG: hypothetical protein ACLQVI_21785, partial [Polyangiaceae bacterium]